jgi:hypothetical protein
VTGRITPLLALAAFKAVKRNRGAAGIDKVSIHRPPVLNFTGAFRRRD